MQCRICLETDQPETMIAPCACRGTAMYIHQRCLDEHTRYYPDRMCSVCKTYMKRDVQLNEVIGLLSMFVMFGSMTVLSDAHPVTKVCGLMSLGIVLAGFSIRNCLSQDVVVLAMSVGILCLFSGSLFSAIMLLILFACLYTLAQYIPVIYLLILTSVVLMGLYVAVFMASVLAHVDHYMATVVFVTLTLSWHGWIKLHPGLRLAAE